MQIPTKLAIITFPEAINILNLLADTESKLFEGKNKDYSNSTTVLANFIRNAERLGLTPFQIWAVYFNKHVDSINSAIAQNPSDPQGVTEALLGRINDARVYLAILQMLLVAKSRTKSVVSDLKTVGSDPENRSETPPLLNVGVTSGG